MRTRARLVVVVLCVVVGLRLRTMFDSLVQGGHSFLQRRELGLQCTHPEICHDVEKEEYNAKACKRATIPDQHGTTLAPFMRPRDAWPKHRQVWRTCCTLHVELSVLRQFCIRLNLHCNQPTLQGTVGRERTKACVDPVRQHRRFLFLFFQLHFIGHQTVLGASA